MPMRILQTADEIEALADAMDQLLDDMGPKGQSVCLYAKAKARIAFEPFLDPECRDFILPLDVAHQIIAEVDGPPAAGQ